MARLSWRKQPNEQGLASIGQMPRGLELRYGGEEIAHIRPVTKNRFNVIGWYFTARSEVHGVPLLNTYSTQRWDTQEAAKAVCDQYVRKHFNAAPNNAT